jgi:hypothetical protein
MEIYPEVSKNVGKYVFPAYMDLANESYLRSLQYLYKNQSVIGKVRNPSRSNKFWLPLYKAIDLKYDVKEKILPTGTTFYRGSLFKNGSTFKAHQNSNKKHVHIYFGLDMQISAWAVVEAFQKKYKKGDSLLNMIGYLHTYKTTKPIVYLYTEIDGIPLEDENCVSHACIHAQSIFHDAYGDYQELGTEFTIPHDSKIFKSIKCERTQVLDVRQMIKHQLYSMAQWSPSNALSSYTPLQKSKKVNLDYLPKTLPKKC